MQSWANISTEELAELPTLPAISRNLNLFGFEIDGVDYDADVNPDVQINDLV